MLIKKELEIQLYEIFDISLKDEFWELDQLLGKHSLKFFFFNFLMRYSENPLMIQTS